MNNLEIRMAMLTHNIKQVELAKKLGVHEITIHRWLGTKNFPDFKKRALLSAINEIAAERELIAQ